MTVLHPRRYAFLSGGSGRNGFNLVAGSTGYGSPDPADSHEARPFIVLERHRQDQRLPAPDLLVKTVTHRDPYGLGLANPVASVRSTAILSAPRVRHRSRVLLGGRPPLSQPGGCCLDGHSC